MEWTYLTRMGEIWNEGRILVLKSLSNVHLRHWERDESIALRWISARWFVRLGAQNRVQWRALVLPVLKLRDPLLQS
jgi:hypothetical protein